MADCVSRKKQLSLAKKAKAKHAKQMKNRIVVHCFPWCHGNAATRTNSVMHALVLDNFLELMRYVHAHPDMVVFEEGRTEVYTLADAIHKEELASPGKRTWAEMMSISGRCFFPKHSGIPLCSQDLSSQQRDWLEEAYNTHHLAALCLLGLISRVMPTASVQESIKNKSALAAIGFRSEMATMEHLKSPDILNIVMNTREDMAVRQVQFWRDQLLSSSERPEALLVFGSDHLRAWKVRFPPGPFDVQLLASAAADRYNGQLSSPLRSAKASRDDSDDDDDSGYDAFA